MTIDDVLRPTAAMIARNMFGPSARIETAWGEDVYHVFTAGDNWVGNLIALRGVWYHEYNMEEAGMTDVVLREVPAEMRVR